MKKNFYSLILVMMLLSCNKKINNTPHGKFGNVVLQHSSVAMSGDFVGVSGDLISLNDSVIVGVDILNSNVFYSYNLKTGVVISFGEKGQGPNEFNTPFNIQKINDSCFICYEPMARSLKKVNIDFKKDSILYNVNENISLAESLFSFKAILNSDFIIGLGGFEKCMFMVHDSLGGAIEGLYEYPYQDKDEKKIPNNERAMAYQGVLISNPHKDKFVYAAHYGDIVHFYKTGNTGNLDIVSKTENEYPQYKSERINTGVSAAQRLESISSYVHASATDKYVYLLYSGVKMEEYYKNDFENYGAANLICVYDWDGKEIETLKLDIPVFNICVNNNDKTIFAIAKDPDPIIVKFDLPIL